MDVEITVALIGAGVSLITPFIALFIKNCCEKDPNNSDKKESDKKESDKKVNQEKKPINNVKVSVVKKNEKENKPKNNLQKNDIESQEEVPKNYCQIIETQGNSITTLCNSTNLKICRFCGMTFCQHHLYVNNNAISIGGHICRDHR